jgi:hypothetical protein
MLTTHRTTRSSANYACCSFHAARSDRRKWYASRIARSVGRVFGLAEHPNNMLNPARFARWTPKAAPWVPVSITLGYPKIRHQEIT